MTKKSFNLFSSKQIALQNADNGAVAEKSQEQDVVSTKSKPKDPQLWRDLAAYWIFGLCNNFGYVVMLTAAHDIIGELSGEITHGTEDDEIIPPGVRPCNTLSTGAVLLADVIPGLIIKLLSPFIPFWARTRVTFSCAIAVCGFIMVAYAETTALALVGVALTSLGSGLGEPTFLAYSAFYDKNVISTWSSGTGGAGIIGSLAFTLLRGFGLTNRQTLLVMICVPVFELFVLFGLLRKPKSFKIEDQYKGDNVAEEDDLPPMKSMKEKIIWIKSIVHHMVPLCLVYFFEYFINQGLFELVYFPGIWVNNKEQYRWYQVTYQIGVFISRSSVNIVQIKQVWVMALLQGINVIFFTFEAVYMFTPSIWVIFVLIFYEGLLGGGAYVNTFYRMSQEISATRREYSMSVVALSDSLGIAAAGFLAMPSHNWMCGLKGGLRLQ